MHELKDAVLEKVDDDVQEPPMYKVVLFNDDFTTMDFVVMVLMVMYRQIQRRWVSLVFCLK